MPILIGDLRRSLSKDLAENLGRVMDKYKNKYDWYYILVRSFWTDARILQTKLIVIGPEYLDKHKLDRRKMKQMARKLSFYDSILFYINNKSERFEMLNVIPQTLPDGSVMTTEEGSITKSLQDLPIIGAN